MDEVKTTITAITLLMCLFVLSITIVPEIMDKLENKHTVELPHYYKILDKRESQSMIMVPVGEGVIVPIYTHYYYLKLESKGEVSVTSKEYDQFQINDMFPVMEKFVVNDINQTITP